MKFRKVDPRIWYDEKFSQLSPTDKLIAFYILTGPHTNRIGFFTFSVGECAECLGLVGEGVGDPVGEGPGEGPGEGVQGVFNEVLQRVNRVCATLEWVYCKPSRVVLLPTYFKYNPVKSKDTLKGYLADLDDIPDTPLKSLFYESLRKYVPCAREGVGEGPGDPVGDPPRDPVGDQEKEKESEKEKEKEIKRRAPSSFKPPTLEEVTQYCNERNNGIDPQAFIDYYQARGWKLSRGVPMKDWKAAIRTWERFAKSDKPDQRAKYDKLMADIAQEREARERQEAAAASRAEAAAIPKTNGAAKSVGYKPDRPPPPEQRSDEQLKHELFASLRGVDDD